MKYLCTMSGHRPALSSMTNQGFAFSRCTRCGHDMIRSTTSLDAKWKPVPEGFRVDWRGADLAGFARKPRIAARAIAVANSATLIANSIRIAVSVLLWSIVDLLRSSDRRARNALDAAGRAIRVSQPKPNWTVSVRINVARARA